MGGMASRDHIRSERNRFRRAQQGRAWSVKDLPKFYYHSNFSNILRDVYTDLEHLLNPRCLSFIREFQSLPFPAQCAYARLSGRKGVVFDADRLNYPEIPDIADQFRILNKNGFVHSVTSAEYAHYLSCLTKPDLVETMLIHLPESSFKKSWRKEKLIKFAVDQISFDKVKISGAIWVQGYIETLDYLLYLHSGRIENSLQNLALQDLGLIKTPKSNRKYGERFETAKTAEAAWFFARNLQSLKKKNDENLAKLKSEISNWPDPGCAQSQIDRDKLLHQIGRACERMQDISSALDVYEFSDSELCNERVIRLRYKLGDKDWVQSRLEQAIDNPTSDNEHNFAQDFYARKFNKKRTSNVTDMLRNAEIIELDEAFKHQPEQAAIKHFKSQNITAIRTENAPWRTLFGLLFWDEIFPEPSAFTLTETLMDDRFYVLNADRIETKLADLNSPQMTMIKLLKTMTLHHGFRQEIFRWGSRNLDIVQKLIQTAPKDALANMLRTMAKNWPETKNGFPDLMVVEDEVCRFVEIKAAGDVVRRNQLTRLKQLETAGFDVSILHISWAIDPNQTYVVVDVETTGGRAGLHRVTEIGAVKVKNGKIIDEWSSLINPQRSIPPNITRLTGISQEMVSGAPIFADIVDSFEVFMEDAIFAAHNVNFDYGFISAEFQMVDRRFRHPKICTCASMRKLYPGHPSYSLKNLCRTFDINLKNHHRALCDAKAAAELLFLINERRIENTGR